MHDSSYLKRKIYKDWKWISGRLVLGMGTRVTANGTRGHLEVIGMFRTWMVMTVHDFKTMKLYHSNGWTLWYVNYISINCFLKSNSTPYLKFKYHRNVQCRKMTVCVSPTPLTHPITGVSPSDFSMHIARHTCTHTQCHHIIYEVL